MKRSKIAVLLSGGVDSSVALRLLHNQGFDVTAFYIKVWLQDEFSFLGNCPWEEDLDYARQVCDQIRVPLEIVPLQDEYWEKVVSYALRELKEGRTPNPDMYCNSMIKFGEFINKIDPCYEKIASGHYAQIRGNDPPLLFSSPDPVKDQTYFLANLSREQLSRCCFPIGSYNKKEVRALAEEFNLPNRARKDSQGVCFLGKIKFRDFIHYHLGDIPGEIIELETGKKLGVHNGYFYYTLGQRQGLGLHGGPWYVAKKDIQNNVIYITLNKSFLEAEKTRFAISHLNWIGEGQPESGRYSVKIRHGAKRIECRLQLQDPYSGIVELESGDKGIAPGQFAVFYKGEQCLGGAVITN